MPCAKSRPGAHVARCPSSCGAQPPYGATGLRRPAPPRRPGGWVGALPPRRGGAHSQPTPTHSPRC
eukprot:scaffold56137_cov56-Phaeocystis_antarctica.AAC.3